MGPWRGGVALVTGGSSGIGASVARRLAAAGMKVAVCARRRERIEALAASIAETGGAALPIECDLRRVDSIASMFSRVREAWGGVDVLVNNAGLGHHTPLIDGDPEKWREMLEVNVLALCVCTREALADMRRQDRGHVVHISSMAAHRVPPGSGVYSATKYAVRSLTEGLRQELRAAGSAIRITAVSPAWVETEFAEHYYQSAERAREVYDALHVLGPDDIADAVAYVLERPPHVQVHDILLRPTDQVS